MIGDRQGVHAQFFGSRDELVDRAGAVEQTVVAMAMEVNEWRRRGRPSWASFAGVRLPIRRAAAEACILPRRFEA